MPFLGDCAVRHMGAVLDAFEQTLFPAMAQRHTDMPVVPEGAPPRRADHAESIDCI